MTTDIVGIVRVVIARMKTLALLTDMQQHNEQHAAELDQMAENLLKLGMDAAAKTIKEAVADFQKGNMRFRVGTYFGKRRTGEIGGMKYVSWQLCIKLMMTLLS